MMGNGDATENGKGTATDGIEWLWLDMRALQGEPGVRYSLLELYASFYLT